MLLSQLEEGRTKKRKTPATAEAVSAAAAATAQSEPKPEEPDDRLEGESKAARDRRVYQDQMREARAERKTGAEAADKAQAESNAAISRQQKEMASKRRAFLMKQADVFGAFLGSDLLSTAGKSEAKTETSKETSET